METDVIFNNLRKKLDVLGYHQPLPGIALVGTLFQDLITTTESLRDCKFKINNLLEERSCWKLGVEPYKCDNSRLLAETNELNLQIIREKEHFEGLVCELTNKVRNLESDKRFLEQHCLELESQIKILAIKYSDNKLLKNSKDGVNMSKKPAFITTVRSGVYLRNSHDEKCSKCNSILYKSGPSTSINENYNFPNPYDYERLQNHLRENTEQLAISRKKIESRNREINRLNEILSGGRTAAALVQDCCYKNVGKLSEDLEILQREKSENLQQLHESQDAMHEAKQRAIDIAEKNKRLQKELDELKKTALYVENEANAEIVDKEKEIDDLKDELQKFKMKIQNIEHTKKFDDRRTSKETLDDKRKLHERLNELTLREQELNSEVDRQQKKNLKLKAKLNSIQKETEALMTKELNLNEEERIRLKSERDFFQKEYLSLVSKSGSDKELQFLQSQIKNKEEEIRNLRADLHHSHHVLQNSYENNQLSVPSSSSSVQATMQRSEREKEIIKSDLERVKIERDSLHEKLKTSTQKQMKETHLLHGKIEDLKCNIAILEKDKRELEASYIPGKTQIILMKEQIDEFKNRIHELQCENCSIKTSYNQIKILHDQTEKALVESQNKCTVSETQLENAESRINTLGSDRDSTRNEVSVLRNEITALKSISNTVESEKDKVMMELDAKTERIYKLEIDLKSLNRKNTELEKSSQELQEKYEKLINERKDRENTLQETSYESKTLRQQLTSLKASRDLAIAENSRITSSLAESQVEVIGIRTKLSDSENEVNHLRKQLQQYVSEVKKAEELLLAKEKERDEMLEHYRCLSRDAVLLEGNNQSLEMEAAEHKQQLGDAESEIIILKEELGTKNGIIEKLESQISFLSAQTCRLENELQLSYDDQKLIKVDLDAMKELCDKLDLQRDKLNAELDELGTIRIKLERENERLRRDTDQSNTNRQYTSGTIEQLLDKTRYELEDTRRLEQKLSQEVTKLKEKNEELEFKLNSERGKCTQKEALVREYNVQLQELRHNLTDDRFRAAQIREKTPRYPTV